MIDSHAEPVGFSIGADGTTDVEVHLTARDLKVLECFSSPPGNCGAQKRREDKNARTYSREQGCLGPLPLL
jgi:hypothetical protein